MAGEEMGDVYFTVSSSCRSQVLCAVIFSAIICEEFRIVLIVRKWQLSNSKHLN